MNDFSNGYTPGEVAEVRTNVFGGLVGAVLGALVGAVLWIGLYQIGIIASIAGIAMITLACKGYEKFSGRIDGKGIFICIIASIFVLAGTQFFCWGLDIYLELRGSYDITLLDAILGVPSIAFTSDFIVDFVKESLIGLILIGTGVAPYIRKVKHERELMNHGN